MREMPSFGLFGVCHCGFMRFFALASDYDGTLAHHAKVDPETIAAIRRLKESGRKFILVTGREMHELLEIFPEANLCDRIVAENGALLYNPGTREERILAKRPPTRYVDYLKAHGVQPLSVGKVIVATFEPYEAVALRGIHELGLELQIIFNKGSVMILPTGVNKATGLTAALEDMGLSHHNVVGVGDAENDHAFMDLCERSVAVANALPILKEKADWVTRASQGAGVAELINEIVADDLRELEASLPPCGVALGTLPDQEEFRIPGSGINILIAGSSGAGKSTLVTSFLERVVEKKYQTCIIDPEGDYPELEGFLAMGTGNRPPSLSEVVAALEKPGENVVVNLIGLRLEDRPGFFLKLFPHLHELRARTGRPHWIVIDESHHVLPSQWHPSPLMVPLDLKNVVLVTVEPDHVAHSVVSSVDLIVAVGDAPQATMENFCHATNLEAPFVAPSRLEKGKAIGWWRARDKVFTFENIPPKAERRRHIRKYSQGELSPDQSFYFEGPHKKLHLRAQNLQLFIQMAAGLDDDTWLHHLHNHDYSRWFEKQLKDEELAAAATRIENDDSLDAAASRKRIREEIEQRYTAPA